MSEHPASRSSVGSRSSALPPHQQRLTPAPDPLASVWIRRLHLSPNPPPPPRPPPLHIRAPPPAHQDAISTDESHTTPPPPPLTLRGTGFGPFRWSPRPLLGAPAGAWDAAAAASVGVAPGGSAVGGDQTMLSPFFRLPAPLPSVVDFEEAMPLRPLIGLGSHSGSGGFPGLSRQMVGGGDPCDGWLSSRVAGAAYPGHALDMVPTRTLNDLRDRQHGAIPAQPNLARHDPSSSSQRDEPFSYWNMGRFRRNTATSSVTPLGAAPANFGTKRNADSNDFLPLKLRKLSGAI
ncbi:uncharacterized protein LOC100194269 [Zea mays]|uniref:Uncharacterized protein n=1 Tax=Zea mays TaxID=4577 RepID=A0A804M228_MAIZE|nr:uncharacterized protein LOC100194269 [Zea mays]|eukprot:NP_001132780.2 uncharacterized protein LOC100194269 [Zea mays]